MLDLSGIADAASSLFGNGGLAGALIENPLAAALSESGIDPASLAGLGLEDVVGTLAASGIDVTAFAPEQLQDVLASLGIHGSLDAIAHAALDAHELR